jgi:superfamily I DNA/RNA helicase
VNTQPKTSTSAPFMTMASNRYLCARTLAQRELPVEIRLGSGDFDPSSNKVKVMTKKVRKGLELPGVALPGVGHMPAAREDGKEVARVFYVAATRATNRLVMGVGGPGLLLSLSTQNLSSRLVKQH